MLFPTIEFVMFALITLTFWLMTSKNNIRLFLLIIFNCIFYSYMNGGLLLYLVAWSGILYLGGKYLNIRYIILSSAILQLVFWKAVEANFISFHSIGTPLGISFFTFQGLTYLFARMKLPKNRPNEYIDTPWEFSKIFAFTGFFPTVLSGPILRAKYWENQFLNPVELNIKNLNIALTFIALGSFYKLCLASIFHEYVSLAFANPKDETWFNLLIGFYAYSFEIFHDFAGYSLMSIGVALLYGFSLPDNFLQPYLSRNIRDFWQKWHITFSMWLRDYFYFSLGGSKVSTFRHLTNSMIVMFVCGLWHGLTGNYIVWGLMHGVAICAYHLSKNILKTTNDKPILPCWLAWFITFHYVGLAWIFFRSPDIQTGIDYTLKLLSFDIQHFSITGSQILLFLLFGFCLLLQKIEPFILNKNKEFKSFNLFTTTIFWSVIFIGILIISPSGMPPFIYFSY